jgi:hypothetical protein
MMNYEGFNSYEDVSRFSHSVFNLPVGSQLHATARSQGTAMLSITC